MQMFDQKSANANSNSYLQELEKSLKATCEEFIMAVTKLVVDPMLSFVTKVSIFHFFIKELKFFEFLNVSPKLRWTLILKIINDRLLKFAFVGYCCESRSVLRQSKPTAAVCHGKTTQGTSFCYSRQGGRTCFQGTAQISPVLFCLFDILLLRISFIVNSLDFMCLLDYKFLGLPVWLKH